MKQRNDGGLMNINSNTPSSYVDQNGFVPSGAPSVAGSGAPSSIVVSGDPSPMFVYSDPVSQVQSDPISRRYSEVISDPQSSTN